MKTLQEQYNLIKEGKGHKDVFMKSARKFFPQFISNITSFDDATKILKQKQVINEGIGGLVTTGNPFAHWAQFLAEEAKVVEKKPTKAVTDMETAGYNYKDLKDTNNLNFEEMLRGYYAEMKDPKNTNKTEAELKSIVAKNLTKDSTYYTTNQAFGIKGIGYSQDHPGLGPTKVVKGKYASSGMEPVKIKEDMIKLTDLLKEGIGGYIDIRPMGLGNTYSESLAEIEDQEEKEAHYKGAEEDDAAHIDDLEHDMEDDKKADKKIEKEGLENRLRQIEVAGNVAALEAKMNAIDEEIDAREGKLAMVQENEAIAEFINPARIKEINREIKELQKAQAKYGKLYEKVSGKSYVKKEIVDETDELGY